MHWSKSCERSDSSSGSSRSGRNYQRELTLKERFDIDPEITSLFDTFIKVVGLFMGVLGGLFLLGVLTQRARAGGGFTGAVVGACMMCWLFFSSTANGYLYITIGMATCIIVGYLASFMNPATSDLNGLTIYTLDPKPQ